MSIEKLRYYFLLTVLAGAGVLVFFIFKPFLVPLSLAAIFAVILKPVFQHLLQYVKGWPGLAALGTILFALVCVVAPISFLGVQIVSEAQRLLSSLSHGGSTDFLYQVVTAVQQLFGAYIPGAEQFSATLSTYIDGYTKEALSWVVGNFGSLLSGVAQTFFSLLVFLIALFYLLRDGEQLRGILVHLSPLADRDDNAVFDKLELAVNSVVRGNLTIALIQGILSGIGLWLFNVPNPLLWGLTAGFSALVPGLGTSLVFIPSILFLLVTGHLWDAVGLLLWAMLAVGLVDNFLGPRLVGRGARLHPLVVLLAVLGGVVFFGPAGLFLGPLCASLLFALLAIYMDTTRN